MAVDKYTKFCSFCKTAKFCVCINLIYISRNILMQSYPPVYNVSKKFFPIEKRDKTKSSLHLA